jgi:hypothetical protein
MRWEEHRLGRANCVQIQCECPALYSLNCIHKYLLQHVLQKRSLKSLFLLQKRTEFICVTLLKKSVRLDEAKHMTKLPMCLVTLRSWNPDK